MSALIGALRVTLGIDTAAFEEGLGIAQKRLAATSKSFQQLGDKMAGIGKTLSLTVTAPLVAFGVTAIKASMESADAMAQVNAALKSMGAASGRTAAQLQALASGEMAKSLYHDDDILRSVTANLLTFGRIAGPNFDLAQQAAIDLAARLKKDLQSATLLVGKALNDPVKGMTAMRRASIQFTEAEQDQIKTMVKHGDVAGAQAVMLKELQHQFGGAAEAARKADPFGALKESFRRFQEDVGGKIIPLMTAATGAITGLLTAFDGLSPGVQQAAVTVGILAAALGPVMAGLGGLVSLIGTLVPVFAPLVAVIGEAGLTGVFGALATVLAPVLGIAAAVAAVGVAIYENWDKIAPVLQELWRQVQQTLGPPLAAALAAVKQAFDEVMGSQLVAQIKDFAAWVGNLGLAILKAFGGAVPGIVQALGAAFTGVVSVIADAVRLVVEVLSGNWAGAWQAAKDLVGDVVKALIGIVTGLGGAVLGAISGMVKGVGDWIGGKLGAIFDSVGKKIDQVKQWFFGLYDAVVGHSYVPDMVDGIAEQMARLDAVLVQPAQKATTKAQKAFHDMAEAVKPILDRLFPEQAALNQYRADQATIEGSGLSDDLKRQALARLSGEYAQTQQQAWEQSRPQIDFGAGENPIADFSGVQDRLAKFTDATTAMGEGVQAVTVKVAKSFKDMADQTMSALDKVVQAVKGGGFLDILQSVIGLGLQLGSDGLFGKTIQTRINATPPGRASGGPVLPNRPYLVGEKRPELFVPSTAGRIVPSLGSGGMVKSLVEIVDTTGLFVTRVNGQIASAAPAIASAGGDVGVQRVRYSGSRRLG